MADGKGYQGGTRVEGKKESGKQGESFTCKPDVEFCSTAYRMSTN